MAFREINLKVSASLMQGLNQKLTHFNVTQHEYFRILMARRVLTLPAFNVYAEKHKLPVHVYQGDIPPGWTEECGRGEWNMEELLRREKIFSESRWIKDFVDNKDITQLRIIVDDEIYKKYKERANHSVYVQTNIDILEDTGEYHCHMAYRAEFDEAFRKWVQIVNKNLNGFLRKNGLPPN